MIPNAIIVLDASVFVAWISASQRTDAAMELLEKAVMELLEKKDSCRFIVPSIFPVEVRNALLTAERRDRWRIAECEEALELLDSLNLVVTPPLHGPELDEAFRIGRAERLSMYDALYLYKAIDHWAAVASRDGALLAAAARRGREVIDVRPERER